MSIRRIRLFRRNVKVQPLCLPIIIILCMYQLKINLKNAKIFKGELGKYNLQSHSIPHILFDMCP